MKRGPIANWGVIETPRPGLEGYWACFFVSKGTRAQS